ncbi:MAG: iron-containing alcohol dehydrogenase [Eubacterium sp.]|nr:iron-containing alcohol dehydrogenase [Eubacterium sp.]
MKSEFEFNSPVKIVSGAGECRNIGKWVKSFGAKKVLIISGRSVSKSEYFKSMTEKMKDENTEFDIFTDTVPEPPMEIVDELADMVREKDYDLVIAVGGGSPMDTAKAVCMLKNNEGKIKDYLFGGDKTPKNPSVSLICIPTTAGSGSEVSCASVIEDTTANIKLSCTHPNLYPKLAILDPLIQLDMPKSVTAGTGMDAMTHAIESYTSKNASIMSAMYSRRAIELIAEHLPIVINDPNNIDSRMHMAIASTMAAVAFANGGLGAVHGISQATGGIAHTPHGITNAILLPKVMKYNCMGNTEKFADIAKILGADTDNMTTKEAAEEAAVLIAKMNAEIGIPDKLSSLGVTEDMFDEIVEGTLGYRLLWMNPIEVKDELVYKILEESL